MNTKLHCPRCGAQFNRDTKYCRTCGLSLSGIVEIVSGEPLVDGEIVSKPNPKIIRLGIGLFIFGTFLGLLHGALRELALYPESFGKFVFLAFLASGMLLLALSMLFPTKEYKRRGTKKEFVDVPERSFDTTGLKPNALNPAAIRNVDFGIEGPETVRPDMVQASVIEHTTRKLG